MARVDAARKPTSKTRRPRSAREEAPTGGVPAAQVTGAEPYRPHMTKAQAREAVETNVGQRIRLSEFRLTVPDLTPEERDGLIDQAELMLEQTYVHLPLKRAMHGTEPIQRLRLLKLRHRAMDERAFQSAMIDIFTNLRDLHTNYVLPSAYRTRFAFLPFRIEEFYDVGEVRKYVITWVSPVNPDRNLVLGAEVTHWNGSPVDLAVARNAEREAGSNPEARRAQGIESLTLRWFGMSLPPDEDWVVLTYKVGDTTREVKFHWEVIDTTDAPALLAGLAQGVAQGGPPTHLGVDLKSTLLDRARTALFDPPAVQVKEEMSAWRAAAARGEATRAAADDPSLAAVSTFPEVYPRFGPVDTPSGRFGYIRLRTFAPSSEADGQVDLQGAINEFARLLTLMPPSGLILDVRANGGGYVAFGEIILQMLTPGLITPEPFHFLATALTHRIVASAADLDLWRTPIGEAIETGASFSQGFPLTSPEWCNLFGQVYQGPVVLVTDARCYSTTDIFTAGFQDHGIGKILGVHNNTGAGGANVWSHEEDLVRLALPPPNPFVSLPQGAGMRVAIRRSTRVGARSGVPLEDLGVVPDILYRMTRRDVLEHNVDLIAKAATILAEMDTQTLRINAVGGVPVRQVTYEATNLDRIDLLVNGRPVVSQDVMAGTGSMTLPAPAPADSTLTAQGFHQGTLAASSRLRV